MQRSAQTIKYCPVLSDLWYLLFCYAFVQTLKCFLVEKKFNDGGENYAPQAKIFDVFTLSKCIF